MKLTGKNTSLVDGEGVHSPPAPFIEVEDEHAKRLIALDWAKEYVEGAVEVREPDIQFEPAPAEEEPAAPAAEAEPEASDEVAPVEAAQEAEPSDLEVDPPSVGVTDGESSAAEGESLAAEDDPAATPESDPEAERLREIADHIHLLSEDDLVKTGARAGKARVDVLSGALGYPVTVEDVDAAMALDA